MATALINGSHQQQIAESNQILELIRGASSQNSSQFRENVEYLAKYGYLPNKRTEILSAADLQIIESAERLHSTRVSSIAFWQSRLRSYSTGVAVAGGGH